MQYSLITLLHNSSTVLKFKIFEKFQYYTVKYLVQSPSDKECDFFGRALEGKQLQRWKQTILPIHGSLYAEN